MPAGRPLKFKTVKELRECDDFKNESELQEYLVINADKWVKDFFDIDNFNLEEQYYFGDTRFFGANKPKIDLFIESEKNHFKVGIEVKNPVQLFSELSRSISQLLSYGAIAEECGRPFNQMAIITSKFDSILIRVVKKYKLPIRLFVVTKSFHCEII